MACTAGMWLSESVVLVAEMIPVCKEELAVKQGLAVLCFPGMPRWNTKELAFKGAFPG